MPRLNRFRHLATPAVVALALTLAASPSRADLVFYNSQSAFTTAAPSLPEETFEESLVPAYASYRFAGPLSSTTTNQAFPTGITQTGISFASVGVVPDTTLITTGANTTPGASKALGETAFGNAMEITLANANAIGLNLFASPAPGILATPVNFLIQVYGASGLLGSETVTSTGVNSYFGATSGSLAITKVDITESGAPASTFVDNVSFGKLTTGGSTSTSDQAAFLAAHPALSTEGFEAAQLYNGQVYGFSGPLTSATNNGVFTTGSILSGLSIAQINSNGDATVLALGAGTIPGSSKVVGLDSLSGTLELTFGQPQFAVGFNLLASVQAGVVSSDVFDVLVYSASGLIDSFKVNVSGINTFLGIMETQSFNRIDITSDTSSTVVFVDNITFTPTPAAAPPTTAVPEPSSLILVAVGLAAPLISLRKRRHAAGGARIGARTRLD